MILEIIVAEPLQNNVYLLVEEKSSEAAVIDPAMGSDAVLAKLSELNIQLQYIINTHGHFDHTADNAPLQKATGAKISIHREDAYRLEQDSREALSYMPIIPPKSKADILLQEGDELKLGEVAIKVLHTPGHTEGSSCFHLESDNTIFTGDTLFAGTCGRTDFIGGDPSKMVESLSRLSTLPRDMKVYPGHGLPTTIGEERWIGNKSMIKALVGVV
ncbi:MAG: MBL fold metallo-hydrolase [Thaumarchaeota archaeon]|nr:MBL fold metallo-hydrolase [Nitrososphaerota archaeon]